MFAKFFSFESFKNVCKVLITNIVEIVIKTISVSFIIPLLQEGLKELNGKYMN